MKLRLRNNSIRLRLSQTEVAFFAANGAVEETIEFGLTDEERLIYRLKRTALENPAVDFHNGKITIFVPHAEAKQWMQTDQIGIEFEQNLGEGKTLKIIIEKDFACLKPRADEDETDAFPRPQQGSAC